MATASYKGEPYRTLLYTPGPITKFVHIEEEKRNAITGAFILEFGDALHKFQRNPEANVGVFLSTGQTFCAGHNLEFVSKMEDWAHKTADDKKVPDTTKSPSSAEHPKVSQHMATEADWRDQLDFMRDKLYYPLWDCHKPLIVGVQGGAYMGGIWFALMHDIVVMAEDAFFDWGQFHVSGGGADPFVAYFAGWRKAMEVSLTGWNIGADEALQLGLVNKVVPKDRLEEEVMRYAKVINAMDPERVRIGKAFMKHAMNKMGMREAIFLLNEIDILKHMVRSDREDEFYRMVRTQGIRAAANFIQKPFEELGYSRYGPSAARQKKKS